MKKIYLFLFILFIGLNLSAQLDTNDFVTTWKTNVGGTVNATSIQVKVDPNYTFNYDVDWNNDGLFDDLAVTGDITHTYATSGFKTIRIRGIFPSIKFGSGSSRLKVFSIDQWGSMVFSDLANAFRWCSNLSYSAIDSPNFGLQCDNLSGMFEGAYIFNGDISNWDVSSITNMSHMFTSANAFNQDISSWDVSNVVSMQGMFRLASNFNQNLNIWDVSSVTNMSKMFDGAILFNQDISGWDVSNVTNMSDMFFYAKKFNQGLNTWDVSSVTNMSAMFNETNLFNQNLNSWDVSSVTNMVAMFGYASAFNGDISSWDVSSVTNMAYMFNLASAYNQPLNNWNVSAVTDMRGMFSNSWFTQDISNWDVSSVTNMASMFYRAYRFNQDISNWDVSSVTSMNSMFNRADFFDQNLGSWNISLVVNMAGIFSRYYQLGYLSTANYDSTLIAWQAKPHQLNVPLGAQGVEYCLSESARSLLIADGWVFTGDSKNCMVTSLEEKQYNDEISFYPNPTNGIINIAATGNFENQEIQILNSIGQVIKSIVLNGSKSIQIDLSAYPEGLYYVKQNNRVSKLVLGD